MPAAKMFICFALRLVPNNDGFPPFYRFLHPAIISQRNRGTMVYKDYPLSESAVEVISADVQEYLRVLNMD